MEPTSHDPMNSLPINLHQLVGLAAGNSMPTAVHRNSFIVNEVPRDFQIATDENTLATLLNGLVATVVNHTHHSCIRIKAIEYDDIICVVIRDNSSFGNYADTHNLEQMKFLAKKMNGILSIRNLEDKFTTILLCFPNSQHAA